MTDPFSFTYSGEAWRTQSWLLELIYAGLGSDLEWVSGYITLTAFFCVAAIGIAIFARTKSARITSVALIWLELIGLRYFAPRPVIVSFALLGVLILVLRTDRLRWTIPLLLWVWASMHGSFVLGGGLIILDGLARKDRRRAVDALAAGFAVSMTAHGWHVWEILVQFVRSSESLELISEWAPPDVLSLAVLPYTVLVVATLVQASRGALPLRQLWVVAPFLVFGLSTVRALMPASLVLLVWLATSVRRRVEDSEQRSVMATVLTVALVVGPWFAPVERPSRLHEERFPIEAASRLIDVPTFHDDVIGGYLIFAGFSSNVVLVDDRAELYSADFLADMVATRRGEPRWRQFFVEHEIEQVLIRTSDAIGVVLSEDIEWAEVYRDADFVVWRRA